MAIVNFDFIFKTLMQNNLHQEIQNLEDDILHVEENIVEFLSLNYDEGVKKSLSQLESNLKYLSIIANGAPINRKEDRKIMDFLRIHYNYLQKLSIPA